MARGGAQRELARRAWEKAWTDEPFVLAWTVCEKMWAVFKAGPPDDESEGGSEGQKKR